MTTTIAKPIYFEDLAIKYKMSLESEFGAWARGKTLEEVYDTCDNGEWLCVLFERAIRDRYNKNGLYARLKRYISEVIFTTLPKELSNCMNGKTRPSRFVRAIADHVYQDCWADKKLAFSRRNTVFVQSANAFRRFVKLNQLEHFMG